MNRPGIVLDADLGAFSMFGRKGAGPHKKTKRGPSRPDNVGKPCDVVWFKGSLYSALRHLKVYLVLHDIPALEASENPASEIR